MSFFPLRIGYTEIDVGWGAPPHSLAGFKGAASRQEGNGGQERTREEEREREGKGGSWGEYRLGG